ncbi:MAG: hypothetical protein ACVCEJ_07020 [Candidatus Izemoplasmataceae bacterium]
MKANELKKMLNPLSKSELTNLLLELNKQQTNKLFFDEHFLGLTYDNMLKMINQRINQYMKYGYVNARDARFVFEGFNRLIRDIQELDEPMKQINLLVQLLAIGGNLIDVDHSYGGLQEVQGELLYHIKLLLNTYKLSYGKEGYMCILQNAFHYHKEDNLLGIDDWRNLLFVELVEICITDELYQYFNDQLTMIEEHIKEDTDDVYGQYRIQEILQVRFLLIRFKDEKKAKQFVLDHLHFPAFRGLHLELLVQEELYEELFHTASKYLNDQKGDDKKLLKYRLLAAEKLDKQEIIRESARLLLEFRDYGFYDVYKSTFKSEDINEMIEDLLMQNDLNLRRFVVIEENLQAVMVKDINKNPNLLGHYYEHLSHESFIKIKESYQTLIYGRANQANKRSHYRRVCDLIESYQEDYQTKAEDIINALELKYHRKTAFLNELSRVRQTKSDMQPNLFGEK